MQTTCRCVLVLLPVCWVLMMLMLAVAQQRGVALLSVIWNHVVKSVLPDTFLTWGRRRKTKELICACCLLSISLLFWEGSVKSFATFVPKCERVTAGCAQWVTVLCQSFMPTFSQNCMLCCFCPEVLYWHLQGWAEPVHAWVHVCACDLWLCSILSSLINARLSRMYQYNKIFWESTKFNKGREGRRRTSTN